jgi:hypothetical protein
VLSCSSSTSQELELPIQVRNAGKSPVPFTERAGDGRRTIEIGTIAAGEWREISFQRLYRPDQPAHPRERDGNRGGKRCGSGEMGLAPRHSLFPRDDKHRKYHLLTGAA